eukprot:m.203018 g.203018  ORF g.203018 m.203018 type:complete len:161 (+) comp53846_c0_seq14:319-801(+)
MLMSKHPLLLSLAVACLSLVRGYVSHITTSHLLCVELFVLPVAGADCSGRGRRGHPELSLPDSWSSSVPRGPVQYLGWWQNNSTATAPFTTFAFLQLFPADLVSDKQLGLTGLWNLDGRDSRPKPDCLAFLWCDGRFFRGGPACTLTWQGNDIDLGSNVR